VTERLSYTAAAWQQQRMNVGHRLTCRTATGTKLPLHDMKLPNRREMWEAFA
jgi:hypothetical protein